MGPLLFEPHFRPQVWGGRRLESVLGKKLPPSGQFGESWELSAHPLHISRLRNQEFAGQDLATLWYQSKQQLWGPSQLAPPTFPWLVKFLDCEDYLSIQVHPDDRTASQFTPSERGKTEVWVIVSAEPGARVFIGLKPHVTREHLRHAIQTGQPETCLNVFTPRPGDIFFIPPGTVHSAGGGVVLAEIQTSSDATFRMYDWNRLDSNGLPRPLHIEAAFHAIDWEPHVCGLIQNPRRMAAAGWECQVAASTQDFHVESWQIAPGTEVQVPGMGMTIVVVLSGTIVLEANESPPMTLQRGETVLIPACITPVRCWAQHDLPVNLLVCSPPR